VALFEGRRGDYVLLGIRARSGDGKGVPFEAQHSPDAAPGLCAELTEQPGRRLVHLVNYRDDGPIKEVSVRLRLPEGRKVKSVTLASPEREGDQAVQYAVKDGAVSFTVPAVGVYEIALVAMQ